MSQEQHDIKLSKYTQNQANVLSEYLPCDLLVWLFPWPLTICRRHHDFLELNLVLITRREKIRFEKMLKLSSEFQVQPHAYSRFRVGKTRFYCTSTVAPLFGCLSLASTLYLVNIIEHCIYCAPTKISAATN